jgi:hypothetical protein
VPAATCVPAAGVTFVSAIDADLGRPTVVITPGGEAGGRTEHGNGGRTRRGDRGVGEYQPLTARARRLRLRRGIPAGFLYLAVVLDAYSRRIVGWSMATTLATRLVLRRSCATSPEHPAEHRAMASAQRRDHPTIDRWRLNTNCRQGIRHHAPKGQQDSVPRHLTVHTPTSRRFAWTLERVAALRSLWGEGLRLAVIGQRWGRFWIRNRSEGTSFAAASHMDRRSHCDVAPDAKSRFASGRDSAAAWSDQEPLLRCDSTTWTVLSRAPGGDQGRIGRPGKGAEAGGDNAMSDLCIRCGSSRSRATITAISLVGAAGHDHQG